MAVTFMKRNGTLREPISKGWFLTLAACALFGACGGGNTTATAPNATGPSASGYAGEWSGTTSQGQPISFSVSSDQTVTALSVGYVFSGCSGIDRLSGLSEPIIYPASTGGLSQFGRKLADGRAINVTIAFVANQIASGAVVFCGAPSCGSTGTGGRFNASRR
jgi:hypothetical protein